MKTDDPDTLAELANAALRNGQEEKVLPRLKQAASKFRDARLWQWSGLLERSLDERAQAIESFAHASSLAVSDATIAHGRARVSLEAGIPAVELFESALALAPSDGDVLLGYVAALFAAGRGEEAEEMLDAALDRSPFWANGHHQLAQLRATLGKRDLATDSIERALRSHPEREALWTTLFGILLSAQDFAALDESVARARSNVQPEPTLLLHEAIAAGEQGQTARADSIFERIPTGSLPAAEIWRIRHLLRSGRTADAMHAIDRELLSERAPMVWPYAAVAWRIARDSRWEWLEGDLDRFVAVIDLTPELSDIPRLKELLRRLHVAKDVYLDQSVRGGSQTDGPLLSRIEPEIRTLRRAIVAAVKRHVKALPPRDPNHPLLRHARDQRVRFSGSWSVLLHGSGHHANHVHPQGWISSALYLQLPERGPLDDETAGWLTLGQPQAELGVELPPNRMIEPRVGQLVLFPSWMWHGTIPFERGERMTVAFDVRPPMD